MPDFSLFFPAVTGIGRPAFLLAAGRGKGSIGTVIIEDTFHAGIMAHLLPFRDVSIIQERLEKSEPGL